MSSAMDTIEDISFAATSFSPTAESNSELTLDEKIDAGIEDALGLYFNLLEAKTQYTGHLVDLPQDVSPNSENGIEKAAKKTDDYEKDAIYATLKKVAEKNPRIKADFNGCYSVPEGLLKLFSEAYLKYKTKLSDVIGEAGFGDSLAQKNADQMADLVRYPCRNRVWKEAETRRLDRVRKIDFKISLPIIDIEDKDNSEENIITQNQTPEPQKERNKQSREDIVTEETPKAQASWYPKNLEVNDSLDVNSRTDMQIYFWKKSTNIEPKDEDGIREGESGSLSSEESEIIDITHEESAPTPESTKKTDNLSIQSSKVSKNLSIEVVNRKYGEKSRATSKSYDKKQLQAGQYESTCVLNSAKEKPIPTKSTEDFDHQCNYPLCNDKVNADSDTPNLHLEPKISVKGKHGVSSKKCCPTSSCKESLKDDFKNLNTLPSLSCLSCNSDVKSCTCSPKTTISIPELPSPSTTVSPSTEANPLRPVSRRLERPRSVSVTEFWVCRLCTLQNPPNVHRCEVCRWDKNKDVKHSHAHVRRKWSCEKCTFKNQMKSETCEMCQSSRTVCASEKDKASLSSFRLAAVVNSKKGVKQKYHEIVAYCNKAGDYFVDDSFPPAPKSLYYNPKAKASSHSDLVSQWVRPKEIITEPGTQGIQWATYRTPLPSDISQGVLGNCWLLSALAVIAERKELLEKILITPDISSAGAYLIRLCKDGTWIDIIIDDLLPCDKKKNLVYSQAKRKQLWVPLIEKAVAKLHGCYEALVSGRAIEGLATLTGYPCESISLQGGGEEELDRDLVWAQLLSCYAARFLMGASCGGGNMKVDEDEYREKGLRPRHAYSVLNVVGSNGLRLLRLRNPWGRYSWKGDYCDEWSEWTPELRSMLMPHGSDDGVFWIAFDDMLKYFDCIDVCKVRDFWYERRIQGMLPPAADFQYLSCILITVMEPTEIEISLFQQDHRKSEKSQRSHLDLCVVLFRGLETSQSDSQKLVLGRLVEHSKRQVRGFVGCHKMVETGFYLAVPLAFNHWHTGAQMPYPNYVMSIHSSKKVLADKIAPPAYMLADAIIRLTMERGQRHEGRESMTAYYLTKGWAGLVVVVENRQSDKWIQIKCDCQESYNVVSTRGQLKTVDAIPPLNRQVIIILTQLEGSGGFSIAHRLTHRPSLTPGLHDWGPNDTNHWPLVGEEVEGLHSPRPI